MNCDITRVGYGVGRDYRSCGLLDLSKFLLKKQTKNLQ